MSAPVCDRQRQKPIHMTDSGTQVCTADGNMQEDLSSPNQKQKTATKQSCIACDLRVLDSLQEQPTHLHLPYRRSYALAYCHSSHYVQLMLLECQRA